MSEQIRQQKLAYEHLAKVKSRLARYEAQLDEGDMVMAIQTGASAAASLGLSMTASLSAATAALRAEKEAVR